MGYTLNGLPLHPIIITAPPEPPFDEIRYRQNLKRQSHAQLVRTVTTAPPKQPISTTGLRQNVLEVKEVLGRGTTPSSEMPGPSPQAKPAAHDNKTTRPT
jgi:hypothetical protein